MCRRRSGLSDPYPGDHTQADEDEGDSEQREEPWRVAALAVAEEEEAEGARLLDDGKPAPQDAERGTMNRSEGVNRTRVSG